MNWFKVSAAALALFLISYLPVDGAARQDNVADVGPRAVGSFPVRLPGGEAIEVFTYRAAGHGPEDPVILVLPGGGRNGADYRDSWIAAADKHRLLVLAPAFDEAQFPGPINYNLAGMIAGDADVASLRDVEITPRRTWLFSDLDAIFEAAVRRFGSRQRQYDLFGHSAGGQIIHRMMLAAPSPRVRTAIAANSGWYTTPAPEIPFPYGLSGLPLTSQQLRTAFSGDLVIFLGAQDNAEEARGHLRQTEETAAQGPHRLARGRRFHALAQKEAARRGFPFKWRLHIVPGVGHDYRAMGEAAADFLYSDRTARPTSSPGS
ncbi:hypothetical protein ACFODL_06425 [Phenylobacterium terrae]|uniref:Alpha/beta hydrolase n=1 Tax=Phenylobacterium terrae TaxID=2665495 RepID=A0ABW4N7Q2_9CAUL